MACLHKHTYCEFKSVGSFIFLLVKDIAPFEPQGTDRRVPPDTNSRRFPHVIEMPTAVPCIARIEEYNPLHPGVLNQGKDVFKVETQHCEAADRVSRGWISWPHVTKAPESINPAQIVALKYRDVRIRSRCMKPTRPRTLNTVSRGRGWNHADSYPVSDDSLCCPGGALPHNQW